MIALLFCRKSFITILCVLTAFAYLPAKAFDQAADAWEVTERFFPGTYFFRVGTKSYKDGNIENAINMWQLSARLAKKEAHFNLGLLYFKGDLVRKDRSLGLAWLALAAERDDERFKESLAAAWMESSLEDRNEAQEEWRKLSKEYSDAVAIPRADEAFRNELRSITGSRVGSGANHVTSFYPNGVAVDMAWVVKDALRERDIYFDTVKGSATIGEIINLEGDPPKDN